MKSIFIAKSVLLLVGAMFACHGAKSGAAAIPAAASNYPRAVELSVAPAFTPLPLGAGISA